ncbi:hypothetical protein EMIHUDRAFT_452141 [Emiliania huxleyi CCMP1516]|uniref:HMA domain-containing protein n=2 Tax=Emiliania huxleyi TaxID=2903 RepID=A0A0D3IMW4_EMIH1|nr:hypothetical protein EMIHUDRAFT_452141 [Emiliania huxleyi CCMP1516]EOD12599.1 hypothetical protein EMIHUDRAFT_452141 [Emiliania huxleyi CCMP1516]|eukprot:XP_005765028.1 hypothetical protein EMIHUDRAFT_452141 [Emiliania huxleyi CCMP1516]
MLRSTVVRVDHLCCGMEAKLIRDMLGPLEAVAEVKISVTDRRVNVEHTDGLAPESIVDMLNRKHLGASLQDKSVVESVGSSFNHAEIVRLTVNATQIVLFAATLALPRVGFPKMAYGLAWACVAMSVALFHEAYLALRRRSPNVELMMAIAVVGALVQGNVVEAASVGALVTLMDLVKVCALEAVGRRLRGSVVSEPLGVEVPGGGKVPLASLAAGDVYLLRVGDVVPADGRVVAGTAALDESRVTGEAMPQAKRKGDSVLSGAIVSAGYLHVRAEAPVSGSFQARVASAVEEAKTTLSEMEELVGRFATWYTPTVLGLAVALGLYKGFQQFLVVVVAGCPCALLGAAPFVQGATLTLLAGRHRLLVKHARTLEALAVMQAIGLDKTGTLTTGHFELLRLEPLPGAAHTRQVLHRWVAAVEDQDNHPLARSLVASYKGCVADFVASGESLPATSGYQRHGRDGVSATVEGRREKAAAAAGKGEHAGEPPPAAAADAAQRLAAEITSEQAGSGSVLYVIVDGVVGGVMLLDDALKPQAQPRSTAMRAHALTTAAAATVQQLRGLGVRPILLTGDRSAAARRVARAVGIGEADTHAGLLPTVIACPSSTLQLFTVAVDLEQSMLPRAGRGPLVVGFVGDGLNDCPALASAHVGIVLQEVGTQATVDAASAVLQVDIDQLPAAVTIARRARRLVLTNLLLALSINVAVIGLAATCGLPLWLSVLSDSGGLLVVLANSLWPLTWRVGQAAPRARHNSFGLG